MTTPEVIEGTGPGYSLKAQLEVRRRTVAAVHAIAANIRPGMLEEDASAMARELLGTMEMRKGWHKVVVRFGTNTIKEFDDTSEPGISARGERHLLRRHRPGLPRCRGRCG